MGYKGHPYSDKEDRVIRRYYRSMGASWCCMVLGRTRRGINQRARKIGVHGEAFRGHAKLSDDQVRYVRENRHGKTHKQMASELGVHQNTIWQVYNRETYVGVR